MARRKHSAPPRPIAPGDVVTAYCEPLGEWTAAQITRLDTGNELAAVLELDWSGPEPSSVADLGSPSALRLTHHSWNGRVAHCNFEWVLPRSYKVIGNLPLLGPAESSSYSGGWHIGANLARQRHWDAGHRGSLPTPHAMRSSGKEITRLLEEATEPRSNVRHLNVSEVEALDCARLVAHFPRLTALSLSGDLGVLSNASSLNELTSLRRVFIVDLFGMSKDDRLLPRRLPELESLYLSGIPADYAAAMRSTWHTEIPFGTYVEIRKGRKPEWVTENRDNPLRDWDGRGHISNATYKKAVAQYKLTRRAALAAASDGDAGDLPGRLHQIGRDYAEAFNHLDARTGFIETVEREELFSALYVIMNDAERSLGTELPLAREALASGAESARDW